LFFPPGQELALAGVKKQSTLYGIAIQGLSTLGLYCRPFQDHGAKRCNPGIAKIIQTRITERREVILPAKLQMTQNHHIFL
jgi:hypothetical protein